MMDFFPNPLSLRNIYCTLALGAIGSALFTNPVNAAELTSAFTINSTPYNHVVVNLKLSPEDQKSLPIKTENVVIRQSGKPIKVTWKPPKVLKAQTETRVVLIGISNEAKSGTIELQFGQIEPLRTRITVIDSNYDSVHLSQSVCREHSTPACNIEWVGIHARKKERYALHFVGPPSNTSIRFAPLSWQSTSAMLTVGNRSSRAVYDVQSEVVKYTRIQDTLIDPNPDSIALPWPKTKVAGVGIIDGEETFYLPLWVPNLNDESTAGRLYLLQQPRKGQPSFRKIGTFSSEAACKSILDAVGKPILLVSNNHQQNIFKVSTKGVTQIDLLPPKGNRLETELDDKWQPVLTDAQWSEDLDEGITVTRVGIFVQETEERDRKNKLIVQRFSLSGAPLEKATILSEASSINLLSAEMRSNELIWTIIDNRQVLFHKRIPYSLTKTSNAFSTKHSEIKPLRVVNKGDKEELIFVRSTKQGPALESTEIRRLQ